MVIKDVVVIATIFYFFSYYVLPKLVLRKKLVKVIISLMLVYYFYATTIFLEFSFLPRFLSIPGTGYQSYMQRTTSEGYIGIIKLHNAAEVLVDLTYLLAPALIVKLFATMVTLRRQALNLELENVNLELAFLKAQINPHFLFNTLNNVYSLALIKSDKTADTVLKLSDLMRYTLYESNTAKVSLEKEVRFFKNYIELEGIRHSSRVTIIFEIEGSYDELFIAPLIVFPFIENAFKHGINSSIANCWVRIIISVNDGILKVDIKNSRSVTKPSSKEVGGIGIPNTIKRLNLLYLGKHSLTIVGNDDNFSVDLEISLR